MTPEFLRAVERTLKIEGGYSDNAFDRGGPTNLGVTFKTLDRWAKKYRKRPATIEELKSLRYEEAQSLYYDMYWCDERLPCQKIAVWWEALALECFDTGVNVGPRQAAIFLQRALNLLNRNQKLFADLKVDSWVGESSLEVLTAMDSIARGREGLMLAVNIEQGAFYRHLAMEDPTQEEFYRGWLLHRVRLNGENG